VTVITPSNSQTSAGGTPAGVVEPSPAIWSNPPTDYPRDKTVHGLFAELAAQAPDALAVRFEQERVTYAQLNQRANQLARRLQKLGIGRESMVAICVERSVEMMVAILATLKTGAAYVPLDPAYPPARLSFMLADTKAALTIAWEPRLENVAAGETNVVSIEDLVRSAAQEPGENLDIPAAATDLAYVMYTSGSTGQPKGVMVTHRSIVRLVKATNYIEISPSDVFLQLAPVSFDASTLEIWGPLLNGASLAIMPPQPPSLEDVGRAIRRYQVTTLWLTAGLFHLMVEQRLDDFAPIRQLLAGGDVLSPAHVRRVVDAHPGCKVIDGYGPTENTTFTCCHAITRADCDGPIPIGRPISNTQVYILDEELRPVPLGESGELCAAGDGLARGYLNQAELTRKKFVRNPFSNDPDARLYRTGDFARYRADGVIEFLGRKDTQVKIAGHRIELGEIEAALHSVPEIKFAAVTASEDLSGNKKLIAYVVPTFPGAIDVNALRKQLTNTLPAFMIPAAFVPMESLPLGPNGKVNRALLRSPEAASASGGGVKAETEIERTITQAWKAALGLAEVSTNSNFFDLGGDSLQLIEVHSILQKALGVELSITELFEYSTISSLANHLTESAAEKSLAEARARGAQQKAAWSRQKRTVVA
jgi:amino acid adenylation domain-containing protein